MLIELLDRGLAVADAHNPVAFALEIGSDGVPFARYILVPIPAVAVIPVVLYTSSIILITKDVYKRQPLLSP